MKIFLKRNNPFDSTLMITGSCDPGYLKKVLTPKQVPAKISDNMIQNLINHIALVIDRSNSMNDDGKAQQVVKVFDKLIGNLAIRSKETNQETRISVYLFHDKVDCLIYDMDVLRVPSLKNHYDADGWTALIDGTMKAIKDLQLTPQLYSDHAFLIYVLTDGMNNRGELNAMTLNKLITSLADNFTVACMVPDAFGLAEAKKWGFPANNVQIWNSTTGKGVDEAGDMIIKSTDNYMRARSIGTRSTKSLFTLDASNLTKTEIKSNLSELKANEYILLPVRADKPIKEFVESWTKEPYRAGSSYYMLMKPETVQNYKQICIQDKQNGKVYGGTNAREMLGLPDYEVKVSPANYGSFDIFIQSSSTNRKLLKGTKLIVLK